MRKDQGRKRGEKDKEVIGEGRWCQRGKQENHPQKKSTEGGDKNLEHRLPFKKPKKKIKLEISPRAGDGAARS